MKKQPKAMPKLSGEDAERDFWAAADSTDFVDWSKASRAHAEPNERTPEQSSEVSFVL